MGNPARNTLSRPIRTRWMYKSLSKRVLDICLSIIGLIVAAPIIAITALVVRATLGSPVLFRQRRPGKNGTPFTLIKFRTMRHVESESQTDAIRLTRVGTWIRAASVDELPELINVLKGDMSIVGPRPLLLQYVDRYTAVQARRHELRPGITGWAQINGRNELSWDKKFRLDVWYVDNCSFVLDIKIIIITLAKVLARQGITQRGSATAEEFTGERA
jgi:sugar transferase EpsL